MSSPKWHSGSRRFKGTKSEGFGVYPYADGRLFLFVRKKSAGICTMLPFIRLYHEGKLSPVSRPETNLSHTHLVEVRGKDVTSIQDTVVSVATGPQAQFKTSSKGSHYPVLGL